MELHQLRYFCAIAETGSFSRAAQQSHASQPSLSQQIRKLEDELGARLFDRLGRTVRLTELGTTFLPRARAVLRDLEAARSDVVERKTSISGPICVGVIPTIAPYFLPPLLASFSRKYPQARAPSWKRSHRCFLKDFGRVPWTWPLSPCRCRSGVTNSNLFLWRWKSCTPCSPNNMRLQSAARFHLASCETSLFCSCATAIASAKPPWRRAPGLGSSRISFLKAVSSAAF